MWDSTPTPMTLSLGTRTLLGLHSIGHTTPKLNLETWRRHHSRSLRSTGVLVLWMNASAAARKYQVYEFHCQTVAVFANSGISLILVDARRFLIVQIASWWSAAACTVDRWSAEWLELRCRGTVSLVIRSSSPTAWNPLENVRSHHNAACLLHRTGCPKIRCV